jgi:NAD(P)-dependent dehydrogenase (short-subunit alcohol dehydrogenase family)
VPHYERLPVESVPATSRQLREDGVYVITGGLGGIGMAMAANLAATVHARLVLVGRHGLPDPADWDGLLDDAETPETLSRRVHEVRSLRAAGAEVLVIKADISDRAQMRDALDQAVSRFGRLDGVIHAAGLPGVGLTQFKTHQDTSRVLAAKVTGTRVLLDCLADVPVDFVVLFSSITSLTGGGPGQIDYCAANAYLDACAQSGAGGSTRIVAINWGEWRWNAWDDTLAGLDEATRGFLRANRERIGIRFEEGWQALLTALDRPEPQLIVSSQDFPALMDATSKLTARALLGAVGEGHRSGERHPRPQLNTPFVAPDGEQACRIAEIWAQTLGVAEIGVHDNFFDLGGNSLLGIDLVSRMRDALRCDTLVPHILYEAPTVAELVRHVNGEPDETAAADERRLRGRRRREALGKGRHR